VWRCILLDIYWNILAVHGPINVKSPNITSKLQMGFNSSFKGLMFIPKIYHTFMKETFRIIKQSVLFFFSWSQDGSCDWSVMNNAIIDFGNWTASWVILLLLLHKRDSEHNTQLANIFNELVDCVRRINFITLYQCWKTSWIFFRILFFFFCSLLHFLSTYYTDFGIYCLLCAIFFEEIECSDYLLSAFLYS